MMHNTITNNVKWGKNHESSLHVNG